MEGAVLRRYEELARWCSREFDRRRDRFSSCMACGSGCSDCCELESVLPLEARAIERYCTIHHVSFTVASHGCVFLDKESRTCAVYPVRPLICRTHGLPLRHDDGVS